LLETINLLEYEKDDLKKEIAYLKTKVSSLEQLKKEFIERNDLDNDQLKSEQKKIKSLEAEKTDLEAQLNDLSNQKKTLEQDLIEDQKKNKNLLELIKSANKKENNYLDQINLKEQEKKTCFDQLTSIRNEKQSMEKNLKVTSIKTKSIITFN